LKRRLADAQKSLEDRKKAEILVTQIEDIRDEILDVENDIDFIEDEIRSFRADAAFLRKNYELYGRKQLYPNEETIVITEAFIKSLERDLNALPPPFRGILEEIKKEKLKIGDKVKLKYEGPREDNISVAAGYEAEAIALETKRQRLLEKLASLRTQLDGLIAATNDG
jgi:chromosome segregation ATPase